MWYNYYLSQKSALRFKHQTFGLPATLLRTAEATSADHKKKTTININNCPPPDIIFQWTIRVFLFCFFCQSTVSLAVRVVCPVESLRVFYYSAKNLSPARVSLALFYKVLVVKSEIFCFCFLRKVYMSVSCVYPIWRVIFVRSASRVVFCCCRLVVSCIHRTRSAHTTACWMLRCIDHADVRRNSNEPERSAKPLLVVSVE